MWLLFIMSPQDKINKALWDVIVASTDSTDATLMLAVQEGRLKLDTAQFQFVRNLVKSSIEAGYHKSHKLFQRAVDGVLKEQAKPKIKPMSKKNS